MPKTPTEVTEDRLRRAANRQGKRLVKSHVRDPRSPEYGRYFLTEADGVLVAYTGKPREDALTLGQVEERLLYPLHQESLGRWFSREDQLRNGWAVDRGYFAREVVDTRRWYEVRQVIFEAPDDGHMYAVDLCYGLTEYQEMDPFEHLEETVWCARMEQRPVTELRWVPVQ